MTPNPDSRAQESPVGSSAYSTTAGDPARDPFDEAIRLANRCSYKAEMYHHELVLVKETLRQIVRACDSAEHPAACLARGHRAQIQRLLEKVEAV